MQAMRTNDYRSYFPKEYAKESLPDLLNYACNEFEHIDSNPHSIYGYLCVWWYSKLRAAELTERKEGGFTTSTLKNSRQKVLNDMIPNN